MPLWSDYPGDLELLIEAVKEDIHPREMVSGPRKVAFKGTWTKSQVNTKIKWAISKGLIERKSIVKKSRRTGGIRSPNKLQSFNPLDNNHVNQQTRPPPPPPPNVSTPKFGLGTPIVVEEEFNDEEEEEENLKPLLDEDDLSLPDLNLDDDDDDDDTFRSRNVGSGNLFSTPNPKYNGKGLLRQKKKLPFMMYDLLEDEGTDYGLLKIPMQKGFSSIKAEEKEKPQKIFVDRSMDAIEKIDEVPDKFKDKITTGLDRLKQRTGLKRKASRMFSFDFNDHGLYLKELDVLKESGYFWIGYRWASEYETPKKQVDTIGAEGRM